MEDDEMMVLGSKHARGVVHEDEEGLLPPLGAKGFGAVHPSVRLGFIRKVYGILSAQLVLTIAACVACMVVEPVHAFVLGSPAVFQLSLMLPMVLIGLLFCYKDRYPANLLILAAFTVCESFSLGVVCAVYQDAGHGKLLLQALVLTASVFVSLTAYCFVSKRDFSFLGASLFSALLILVVWSFMTLAFPGLFGPVLQSLMALAGAVLFSLYILFDTSLIMHHLGPDDYVLAAINLYLDLINLFLQILRFLNANDR